MKKLSIFIISLSHLIACNTPKKNTPTVTESKKEVISEIQHTPEIIKESLDSTKAVVIETVSEEVAVENKKETKALAKVVPKAIENEANTVVEKKTEKIKDLIPNKKNIDVATTTKVIETKVEVLKEKKEIIPEIPLKPTHAVWNELAKSYVSTNGKVNYGAFKTNIPKLEGYLKELETTPPTNDWSRNEKLAYWFNLYNASTVYLVATNYPIKSIKDINNGKPWDKKFIKSGNQLYSLNDIENTIVRPNYNEPRLHVAFNCAAVSCPNLSNEAFVANKLNTQLNLLAKKWITDSSKNNLSNPDKIEISQIFNWYKVDFKEGIIQFINKYSSQPINENAAINYMEYQWKLND